MHRILVTGGSGLVGTNLSDKGIEQGFTVFSGYHSHEARFGVPVELDICNPSQVKHAFAKAQP
ncbi:MAG: NAD-dependent epimerase/dehydratase family protein, partial [Candidatus Thorarchaeota archaeon]